DSSRLVCVQGYGKGVRPVDWHAVDL
ncbi:MAG: hypothetical protein ACJA00_003258, partial [Myxococcota bacterium]